MGKLTCYKVYHDIIYDLHLFGGKKWLNLSNVRQRLHGCFFICNSVHHFLLFTQWQLRMLQSNITQMQRLFCSLNMAFKGNTEYMHMDK